MMRRLMGVVLIVVVVGMFVVAVAVAEEQCDASGEKAVDVGKVLAEQDRRAKVDFGLGAGFTPQEIGEIFRTKHQIHRLQDELRSSLTVLAVALQSDAEGEEFRRQAAVDYLAAKAEFDTKYAQLQEQLIEKVGANDDPLKLGALMIYGALDNGRRITCGVQSAVSGGSSQGAHGQGHEENLRGSFRGAVPKARRGRNVIR